MRKLYNNLAPASYYRNSSTADPYWDQAVLSIHADGSEDSDPYWNSVVLATHMDGADNGTTFTDIKGHSFTLGGDVKTKTATAKFGTSSAYFDGTGDYLKCTHADMVIGTGDFCLEAWIYPTSVPATRVGLFGSDVETPGRRFLGWNGTNLQQEQYGAGQLCAGGVLVVNTWQHVVFNRTSGVSRIFLNGTQVASVAETNNISHNIMTVGACYYSGAMYYLTGYMDDVRFTKGAGRYSSNFTVPTAAFPEAVPSFSDQKGHVVTSSGVGYNNSIKKFGIGSAYFNGSASYLQLDGSNDFVFATGDFTAEMWINPSRVTGTQILYDSRPSQGVYPAIYMSGANIRYHVSSVDRITGTTTLSTGAWYHVALCRSSGITRLFLNGKQEGSNYTDTNNYLNGANRPVIAVDFDVVSNGFQGYIDDIRVTKGVARYTADFSNSLDPYWTSTVLALSMDGSDNGTVFTDNKGKTVTAVNAVTKTATKKFGTSSAYFDGTGDYLSVPDSADWNISADYSVEFWFNTSQSTQYATLLDRNNGAFLAGEWSIMLNPVANDGRIEIWWADYSIGGPYLTSNLGGYNDGQWHHLAWCISGTSHRLFIDGNLRASRTATVTHVDSTQPLYIGRDPENTGRDFNGYIDDVRITKGVARYTNTFAVNNDQYYSSVVLHMPMDGVDNGTSFYDLTGKAVTLAGTTNTATANKQFGTSSAYFDGTGDYLSLASSADFGFGTGDFTIECWIYSGLSKFCSLLEFRPDNANGAYPFVSINSNGSVAYYVNTADRINSGAGAVSASTWTHIAVSRVSSNTTLYVGGTAYGTWADSTNYLTTVLRLGTSAWIGARPAEDFIGNIDDLRITKGVGRYTANFTPPTAAHPVPNFALPTQSALTPDFPQAAFQRPNPDSGQLVDPYWNNVVLAMHMDGLNDGTVFHDEKGKGVSAVGGTVTKTATKQFGISSAYFDGSNDLLQFAHSADTNTQDSTITVECWIYANAVGIGGSWTTIFSNFKDADTSGFRILLQDNGSIHLSTMSGYMPLARGVIPLSTWTHIAVTISSTGTSGTGCIYVNGTLVDRKNGFTVTNSTNGLDFIGSTNGSAWYHSGYIDDFRITKGVTRYSPTAFSANNDPYYSNVVLHMPMNGSNAGATFPELTGKYAAPNGHVNTVTATKKFGTSSAYFDGASDYLLITTGSDFDFGTGDFTIEAWVHVGDFSTERPILYKYTTWTANTDFGLRTDPSTGLLRFMAGDSIPINIVSNSAVPLSQFFHVAIVRGSGTTKMYINGVPQTSTHTGSVSIPNDSTSLKVGWDGASSYFLGYIDDVRITKGTARYNSDFSGELPVAHPVPNFAVPTRAFPRS